MPFVLYTILFSCLCSALVLFLFAVFLFSVFRLVRVPVGGAACIRFRPSAEHKQKNKVVLSLLCCSVALSSCVFLFSRRLPPPLSVARCRPRLTHARRNLVLSLSLFRPLSRPPHPAFLFPPLLALCGRATGDRRGAVGRFGFGLRWVAFSSSL